jgi:hypothetical protein
MTTLLKIILLAAVSAALAIIIEQSIAAAVAIFWQIEIIQDSYSHFTWFLAVAAIIEEISKYWAVAYVIRKNFQLEKGRFILASLFLGAMWGVFEIGLVLFANQAALSELRAGNSQIIFSFSSIIALHTLTACLMGIFISAETFSAPLKYLKIMFFPVIIHLLFNFLIIQRGGFTNFLTILILSIALLTGSTILAFGFKKLA